MENWLYGTIFLHFCIYIHVHLRWICVFSLFIWINLSDCQIIHLSALSHCLSIYRLFVCHSILVSILPSFSLFLCPSTPPSIDLSVQGYEPNFSRFLLNICIIILSFFTRLQTTCVFLTTTGWEKRSPALLMAWGEGFLEKTFNFTGREKTILVAGQFVQCTALMKPLQHNVHCQKWSYFSVEFSLSLSSLRGICYFNVEVSCASKDLHSGVFGGTV